MQIVVNKNNPNLKEIKNIFGFSSNTKTVNFLIDTYLKVLKENNNLSNRNMFLDLKLKMLKK